MGAGEALYPGIETAEGVRGAVAGPDGEVATRHVLTGLDDRAANMGEFTKAALSLLEERLDRV